MVIKLERDVAAYGGIVSVAQLLALKHWRENIDLAVHYGRLVRVRKGWVASLEVPTSILMAWRIGGTLACVSAVEYHLGTDIAEPLHVLVPSNATGFRRPHDHRARPAKGDAVIHWAATPEGGRDLIVPLGAALRQAARCRTLGEGASRGIPQPAGDTL
jgi:hypothetical protein